MNKSFECYSFKDELWIKSSDGKNEMLTEKSTEFIAYMTEQLQTFYPKAYEALCTYYERCLPNLQHFRFRVVQRFCKCNFGEIDNIDDIDDLGNFNFEFVRCPLRGECAFEKIICCPEFEHRISPAELRVLKLWYQGQTKDEIANNLYLSPHTVCNHIRNAFGRIGVHSKAEFVLYADKNNIFK